MDKNLKSEMMPQSEVIKSLQQLDRNGLELLVPFGLGTMSSKQFEKVMDEVKPTIHALERALNLKLVGFDSAEVRDRSDVLDGKDGDSTDIFELA